VSCQELRYSAIKRKELLMLESVVRRIHCLEAITQWTDPNAFRLYWQSNTKNKEKRHTPGSS